MRPSGWRSSPSAVRAADSECPLVGTLQLVLLIIPMADDPTIAMLEPLALHLLEGLPVLAVDQRPARRYAVHITPVPDDLDPAD